MVPLLHEEVLPGREDVPLLPEELPVTREDVRGPDYVIIGAQKAMTSELCNTVLGLESDGHPDVGCMQKEQMNYHRFSYRSGIAERYENDLAQLRSKWAVVGEKTPFVSNDIKSLENLKRSTLE